MDTSLQSALSLSSILQIIIIAFTAVRSRLKRYALPLMAFAIVNLIGIASMYFETGDSISLWAIGYYLLFIYLAWMPGVWLWLCARWAIDAKSYPKHRKIAVWIGFVASCLFTIGFIYIREIDVSMINNRWFITLGGWRYWYGAYFVLALTTGIYFIETCYRSALGLSREKIKKSFFLLISAGVCYLSVITVGFLYGQISDWIFVFVTIMIMVDSVLLTRHFLRFNFNANSVILTKKGVYSSLTIVLLGIYFLIIGSVGEFLVSFDLDEGLFFTLVVLSLIVVTLAILLFSQVYRARTESITEDSSPYKSESVYGVEWKEFAEEISVLLSIDKIFDRSSHLLYRLLKIEDCFFVIKEPLPSPNYTLYVKGEASRGISGQHIENLGEWLYRYARPIELGTLKEQAPSEFEQIEHITGQLSFEPFILVPLAARQQLLGFWGVGTHASGRDLASEEIAFIEAAASPLALTILTARITDELIVSQEIESYHRFSSFVLHDLKNSVGMLSMLLQNAENNMDDPEFQREALITIKRAVERQQKIISRLTEQKTDERLALESVELKALIDDALNRIRFETISKIELSSDVPAGCPVKVDREKVGSVFDNLLMNAVEAMPNGGSLKIRLSVESAENSLRGVSFTDTGGGMDEEFIATRLFKPFSSTKKHGLGIGMYQSREIIKQHGGRLDVASQPGQGTTFTVYLPAVE
ncbi:MAG: ATP-binding protein [Candidatus Zixiibacteriota bacterium]